MTDMQPTGEVHEVATLFPMLAGDELDELAADIAAHGLHEAIVLDRDGVLLDGRNRLEACKRAGVEPYFWTFEGDDAAAFIISTNIHRRHLTKGQRAMAVVMAAVRTAEGARLIGASEALVSKAQAVVQYARELADQVLVGGSLDQAYAEAQRRKNEQDEAWSEAQRLRREAKRLEQQEHTREASVQLLREEIGPEIPITVAPDLSIRGATRRAVPDPAPALRKPSLDAQHHTLQVLRKVQQDLDALAAIDPSDGLEGWDPTGQVFAVRSAVAGIVNVAYAIARAHNDCLSSATRLKAVPS